MDTESMRRCSMCSNRGTTRECVKKKAKGSVELQSGYSNL